MPRALGKSRNKGRKQALPPSRYLVRHADASTRSVPAFVLTAPISPPSIRRQRSDPALAHLRYAGMKTLVHSLYFPQAARGPNLAAAKTGENDDRDRTAARWREGRRDDPHGNGPDLRHDPRAIGRRGHQGRAARRRQDP